jgi:predicted transglutaminase-like protease
LCKGHTEASKHTTLVLLVLISITGAVVSGFCNLKNHVRCGIFYIAVGYYVYAVNGPYYPPLVILDVFIYLFFI